MTTTTNATIKYKISFEKPSVTKGAAKSNVKVKNGSYCFSLFFFKLQHFDVFSNFKTFLKPFTQTERNQFAEKL